MIIASQTWGYKWNSDGPKGPEPFTREYQEGTKLPKLIQSVGFIDNTIIENTTFDAAFISKRPTLADLAQGRHLEPQAFRRLAARDVLSKKVRV